MRILPDGVQRLEGRGLCSNVYVLEHKNKKIAVDAGSKESRLPKDVDAVFLTHGHFDHCGGLRGEKAFLHGNDLKMLDELNAPYFPDYERPKKIFALDFKAKKFGWFGLEVIETPGHTPGSVCFLEKRRGLLFSGDTLFAGGMHGRTDLVGGSARKMGESLELIAGLDYALLCPGHGGMEEK